jgi:hypothetical protein
LTAKLKAYFQTVALPGKRNCIEQVRARQHCLELANYVALMPIKDALDDSVKGCTQCFNPCSTSATNLNKACSAGAGEL